MTDVVVHGSEVFGQAIDSLIRRLDEQGLWASPIAWEWLYERYWDYRESQQHGDQAQVRRVLEHLLRKLGDEAQRLDADDRSG